MWYWLQLVTIVFGIVLSWANSVPVRHFKRLASMPEWENSEFHQANGWVKAFWAITTTALYFKLDVWNWTAVGYCTILFLWLWLFFDIFLNLWTNMPWYYLGKKAKLDRLVKNGRNKAIICLIIIIILNAFLR